MNLVIVESPTKAKTISKFLGKDYSVESSYGHIRDLPKSKIGIDTEHDFEPEYVVPTKARKRVNQLKKDAEGADTIILATDEDREGEAIAWHLIQALDLNELKTKNEKLKIERIAFHEITESAIKEALKNPREIDMNLVDAQQARRVLDRLVGYKLSPFLWKKLMRGLSAGRVQSVALRLIVDRENEIKNFKPQEYWTIAAIFEGQKKFEANLVKIGNKALEKFDIKTEKEAGKTADDLKICEFKISRIEKKEVRKNPPAPFTTSTLQQDASKRLGFSAKKTMMFAQRLYENGLITYMRTDSLNLSKESVEAAKEWLNKELGNEYAASAPRFFRARSRLAQEAHEAIRPTSAFNTPEKMKFKNESEQKLYQLIWQRFMGSQMPQAIFDSTTVDINANAKKTKKTFGLRTNGSMLKFDGFLKIWPQMFEEKELPLLHESEELKLSEIKPEQHFTEPPPRYSEATLIKTLEEYEIGRPSTYAPIISVIQERNYVTKEKGRFSPTEIGELVNKILVEHFPEIVDVNFTAEMEENLDKIAGGKIKWQNPIEKFYRPFDERLKIKYEEVKKGDLVKQEISSEKCEFCGRSMIYKYGRFGKFLACAGFPECKNTKPIKNQAKPIGVKCPKCLASPDPAKRDAPGEIVERRVSRGRARGKIFWGCSTWPKCDYASWTNPIGAEEKKEKAEAEEK